MLVLKVILSILFLFVLFNTLYVFIFSVSGLFYTQKQIEFSAKKLKIAVLIPAYKEDKIIVNTVEQILGHNYDKTNFSVFVIADQLKNETIKHLSSLPIEVIQVNFSNSTKAKSLKYALNTIQDDTFDIAFILDADNTIDGNCLEKINATFQAGFSMIQLHRTAKNKNTQTAILDGISEEINNNIFRRGHRALGLSSALIGSGMAFPYSLFKALMTSIDIENNPGEDREICLQMLKSGAVCEFIDGAYVFDEKVQSTEVLKRQRTRWISAQYDYLIRLWIKEPIQTITNNFNYIDFALQTLVMPRILMLGTLTAFLLIDLVLLIATGNGLFPSFSTWPLLFITYVLSLILGIYKTYSIKEITKGVISIPKTFGSFLGAVIKARPNQREFIHTPKEF